MCKWRSALDPDYHCRVSPELGSDYCIFHEPGEKDIGRFKQKFYEQLDGDGPEEARNPRYDFRGYFFPTGIVASGGSREAGKLILPKEIAGDLIGSEATIKGDASFEDARIEGGAYFWDATIEGNADFTGATIKGHADFVGAKIEGDAVFWRAKIEGLAFFWCAKIEGDAVFVDAKIEGDAAFGATTIDGDANFGRATIERAAFFGRATIGGNAYFSGATIGENANFDFEHLNGRFELTNASVGQLVCFVDSTPKCNCQGCVRGEEYFEWSQEAKRLPRPVIESVGCILDFFPGNSRQLPSLGEVLTN